MNFFKYCEKVSGFLGIKLVLDNIHVIHRNWAQNKTVGETAEALKAKV
jgi:hypothetical protein